MSERIKIYTDGGAEPNPGPGGWGAVVLPPGGERYELSGGEADSTNNRMELTAAIEALDHLPEGTAVEVHTDSKYVQQGITKWVKGWIAKGWKRKGGPIQNLDLWKRLVAAEARHDVVWKWLKGHAGHRHNERADALATQEIGKRTGAHRQKVEDGLPDAPDAEVFLKVSCVRGRGAWAARVERTGDDFGSDTLTGRESRTTSNRMDLVAAVEALELLPEGSVVVMRTVSGYLKDGASSWLDGWKANGWRTKAGGEVKNAELWKRLDAAQRSRSVHWARLDGKSPEGRMVAEALRGA